MSADTREQVRDSARYLRSVRPIDPEELGEYVTGGAHPAVVRQLLREEAFDLGLVERADGTFVPVPDGPVEPAFDGVDALPAAYDRRLGDLLADRHGPEWYDGESGNRLRNRLRELKAAYFRGHGVEYDEDTALAYAVYHLVDFYAAAQYVYHELGGDGLLGQRLRVLDVGAGVGGPALGLHDYLFGAPGGETGEAADTEPATPPARVEYHALEPGEGADVLSALLEATGRNFRGTIHRERAESFDPDGGYDLIVFGNVLGELDDPVVIVRQYLDALADDGTVVATAPADLETATGLRAVERELVRAGDATVYAPTAWLWPGRHPEDRGWSFDRRPDVAVPTVQERLAAAGDHPDEVRNASVKFAYSLLRADGRRRHDVSLDRGRALPLGDAGDAVTRRVDLVAAKLSRDLRARGSESPRTPDTDGNDTDDSAGDDRGDDGNPVYKIGDGSEREECYAVLVRETALNERLSRAGYGALLQFENALVLWNDDEGGYNVVVDEDAIVDVVGRGADDAEQSADDAA